MAPSLWLRDIKVATSTNDSVGHASGSPDALLLSDYDLAETRAPAILAFTGVVTALALIIVTLRIYIRRFVLKSLGADDVVIIFAILAGLANYVCFIGETTHGLGRHITAISEDQLLELSKWQFFHSWLVLLCASLVKISICLLLLRLVTRPIYRYSIWGIGIFIAIYNLICIGTIVFACIPVAANWDRSLIPNAKCFSISTYRNLGILNSAVAMFTDVLLVILPMPIIYHLQIQARAKLALVLIMSLGLIAVAAGAAKTEAQFTFLADPDRFFHDHFFVWAAVESCFGMMCASMPTLRPLLSACGSKIRKTYNSSSASKRRPSPAASAAESSSHATSQSSSKDIEKQEDIIKVSVEEIYEAQSPVSDNSKHSRNSSVINDLRKKLSIDNSGGRWTRHETEPIPLVSLSSSPTTTGILRTKKIVTISEPGTECPSPTFPIEESAGTRGLVRQPSLNRGWTSKSLLSSGGAHRLSRESDEVQWTPTRSLTVTPEPVAFDSASEVELIHGR